MKQKLLGTALACLSLAVVPAHAAEFVCQDDVKPASYGPEEQRLVDQFCNENHAFHAGRLQPDNRELRSGHSVGTFHRAG